MRLDARSFVAVTAADQIDANNRQWIEVMPTATEARNGKWFFTITADDLAAYAESIQAQPGKIPVDYDHDGARPDGSTKAAGWFTGQARVDDMSGKQVLLAEVQWTPSGAAAIRDGDFKMISPEFTFQSRDAKTGLMTRAKQIIAATLTNRPFFRELAAVASEIDPDQAAAIAADLGVTVDRLTEVFTNHGGRAAQTEGDTVPELKAIAAALGLPETATEDEVNAAAKAAKEAADKTEATQKELDELKATAGDKTEVEKLRADLEAEKKLRLTAERDGILAKAVEERRFDPATSTVLAEQYGENIDGLKALVATFPAKPAGAHGSGGEGPGTTAADTKPVEIDGSTYEVDADSAKLDAKAREILAKDEFTPDEYMTALAKAEKALGAVS